MWAASNPADGGCGAYRTTSVVVGNVSNHVGSLETAGFANELVGDGHFAKMNSWLNSVGNSVLISSGSKSIWD